MFYRSIRSTFLMFCRSGTQNFEEHLQKNYKSCKKMENMSKSVWIHFGQREFDDVYEKFNGTCERFGWKPNFSKFISTWGCLSCITERPQEFCQRSNGCHKKKCRKNYIMDKQFKVSNFSEIQGRSLYAPGLSKRD